MGPGRNWNSLLGWPIVTGLGWAHRYPLTLYWRQARVPMGAQQRQVDLFAGLTVAEVMDTHPLTVMETLPLRMVAAIMEQFHTHGVAVVTPQGELSGIITIGDLERVTTSNPAGLRQPVGQFCTRDPVVAYPDETMQTALQRMGARALGRLPVVQRANPRRMVGWLHRADFIRAYELACQRQLQPHGDKMQRQLAAAGVVVLEVTVEAGSPVAGCAIADLPWPAECLVAGLHRAGETIIPRGAVVLQGDDRLTVVVALEDEARLRSLVEQCRGEA